jgi:histone H3/H4
VSSDRIENHTTKPYFPNTKPSKPTMDSPPYLIPKLTGLPTATVQKIINEVLASKAADENVQSMSFAKETRDLLIECCVEFITMISTEANEIAEKDAKKTIACEHITKALEELGFGEYVQEIMAVADSFKNNQVVSISLLWRTRRWMQN